MCEDEEEADDEWLQEWLEAYKQHKAQKSKIKEELLPIAWYPDRVLDWCFLENKKQVLEML